MKSKIVIPILAVIGVVFTGIMVATTTKEPVKAKPVEEPSKAPFASYASGSGLIESATQNVKIGSNASGIVTKVFVQVGDRVKRGHPLWQIDPGPQVAEIARYQAALDESEATLSKQRLGTRPEEIEKQQWQVQQAQAQVDDAQAQLRLRESAFAEDARAVSQDEINQARNTLRARQAALDYSKGELSRLQRGTWSPDLTIQAATVAGARAQLEQAKVDLDRLTVRSPINGEVLQVKIHAGEFAPAGETTDPLMLVGDNETLVVRAQIDENDAWRVRQDQLAVAFPRGQETLSIPLTFLRFEPYVVPKRSLTGDSTERVDTRVLEVLYSFKRPTGSRLFVGQQMDTYVKAAPLAASAFLPAKGDLR